MPNLLNDQGKRIGSGGCKWGAWALKFVFGKIEHWERELFLFYIDAFIGLGALALGSFILNEICDVGAVDAHCLAEIVLEN